jgi:hypothetical protein
VALALALALAGFAGARAAGAQAAGGLGASPIVSSVTHAGLPFTIGGSLPTVTLDAPASRSNDTTPSFSGTASDTTTITITVYAGEGTEGEVRATLKVQGNGGSWTSARVSPPLPSGTYTALAAQPSSLGNATGESDPVSFEIDTEPPTVTLKAPPSRSNDVTPSFTGTASEATAVTVEVFEGTRPEGNILATVTAQGTSGTWTSAQLGSPLPSGTHTFTALAIQASEIKNPAGRSAPVTFVVDTEPPTVTLAAPTSPSNDTTPSFSGTASETTPVTVEIFAGPNAEGTVLTTASATGTGGSFTSGQTSAALAGGTFTAVAVQPSAIGNADGSSAPVTFVVDTGSPTVTLNPLPSPSGNAAPSFSGRASDHTPVTVQIYSGGAAEGAVLATVTAEADAGEWASARVTPPLEWGEYTARATQPSSIGNASGASATVSFSVAPIAPAVLTEAASAVTRTSVAMYASVAPQGASVNACSFEYGTTAAYGKSIECGFVSGISAFPAAGTEAVQVFARVYGLAPSSTYHFRIVAVGEGGTGRGTDATFTTLPPLSFGEEGARGRASPSSTGSAAAMTAHAIAALIRAQLTPRGPAARIAALLKSGGLKVMFKAPQAGTVAIYWDYLQRAGRHKPPAVLVASGKLTLRSAGSGALMIRVSRAGRRLLGGAKRIRLTATCIFTPLGAAPIRASATFELKR